MERPEIKSGGNSTDDGTHGGESRRQRTDGETSGETCRGRIQEKSHLQGPGHSSSPNFLCS